VYRRLSHEEPLRVGTVVGLDVNAGAGRRSEDLNAMRDLTPDSVQHRVPWKDLKCLEEQRESAGVIVGVDQSRDFRERNFSGPSRGSAAAPCTPERRHCHHKQQDRNENLSPRDEGHRRGTASARNDDERRTCKRGCCHLHLPDEAVASPRQRLNVAR
jgi:hypothetical protein